MADIIDEPTYGDFSVSFTMMPKPDLDIDKLRQVAEEVDGAGGREDDEAPWSYKQCLVVILHSDPGRLGEFLAGWTVNTPWQRLAFDNS